MGNLSFPGIKEPGNGINDAEVKTTIELHFYSPCVLKAGYRIG
jgi:hypothetical protein